MKVKVTLTKKQFEILEDVLSEIQESREYETVEYLAELRYLQMMFSYSHLIEFEKFNMISDDGKYEFEFIEE